MPEHTVTKVGPDFVQDPYPLYSALREQTPVSRVRMPGGTETWLVTRYEDVRAALADPRLHKDYRELDELNPDSGLRPTSSIDAMRWSMLTRDPPDHTRLRRLVNKAFTPRRTDALRPRIADITAALLDAMEDAGPDVDLLESLAFPLPVTVICEMLGIPPDDRENFREWTQILIGTPGVAEDVFTAASTAMFEYILRLLAGKRGAPADDLLSALIQARDEDDRLDESELLSNVFLLLVAGHDTTVNLIGTGTLALLTHPAELARLRDDPALLPQAVEELLRFASPVNHATYRFASQDVPIGGTVIPRGDLVLIALSSANHDPGQFPQPDTLDLSRDPSGHVAFGHGIHYCVGAPLARIEGQIAFGALLERFPGIELAVPPESLRFRPGTLIRGLESLPVNLT
ncbi:MAG: cytochrome P450 [Streptosporangiaceae bacterium]|jgi:cytochrome P450